MTYGATWPEVAAVGQEIDRLGYDFLLMHDHLLATQGDLYQPFFESLHHARRVGGADEAGPPRPPDRRQPVPQPGRRRQGDGHARPHLERPDDPRASAPGSLPEEFPLHGLAVGQTLGDRLQRARRIALDRDPHPGRRGGQLRLDELPLRAGQAPADGRSSSTCRSSSVRRGEKIGLRIAAKYADYWQMSVDPSDDRRVPPQGARCSTPLPRRRPRSGRDPPRCPKARSSFARRREEAQARVPGLRRALRVVRRDPRVHAKASLGRVVRRRRREPAAVPRGRHRRRHPTSSCRRTTSRRSGALGDRGPRPRSRRARMTADHRTRGGARPWPT